MTSEIMSGLEYIYAKERSARHRTHSTRERSLGADPDSEGVRTLHNENQLLMNQVTASASVKPQTYFRMGKMTTRLGASPQTASATTNLGMQFLSQACNILHFGCIKRAERR